jgi:hypothetical protein
VTPGSRSRVVESAKDLKPFNVSDLRNTADPAFHSETWGRFGDNSGDK